MIDFISIVALICFVVAVLYLTLIISIPSSYDAVYIKLQPQDIINSMKYKIELFRWMTIGGIFCVIYEMMRPDISLLWLASMCFIAVCLYVKMRSDKKILKEL
jgi:hypothetical protein